MTFILVTLSIMGVSIFLIYKLTNHFGFRMKYKSLILCAFMAFVVNVAAISMSPYLTQSHYIRLALLIIVSAAVVTFYNERLVQRDVVPAVVAGGGELEEAAIASPSEQWESDAPPPAPQEPLEEPDKARAVPAHPVVDVKRAPTDKASVPATPESPAEKKAEKPAMRPAATEKTAKKAGTKPSEPVGKKPTGKPGTTEKPDAKPTKPAKTGKTEKGHDAKPAPTEKAAEKPALPKKTEKLLPPKPKRRQPQVDFSKFHSLDDILDYAYEQKSGSKWEEAILAYKKALEKYRDDSYAPFIVIDLGNIYKEKAAYNDAIHTYKEALSLPIIANDVVMSGKFRENLSYLRTVQYILSKHNSLRTPFRDIPGEYLREIEAEFQLRQKHS